ncbi:hypothetical protein AK812_SmicGene10377 [Symbiodinium microadriaticum]|uniref:Uncharacterized protein n=1 Tax=Symbiodinium microadriaticum TaxID=2951 RepID=A0A1Q9EG41_SYMMI|nr:hypothetical protein AK812_SmicGene10377 [Symbiodinium microadriaticum]
MSAVTDDDNQQEIQPGAGSKCAPIEHPKCEAAWGVKAAHDFTYDAWEVNEPKLKWIRHIKTEKGNARSSNRSLQDSANANVPIDRRQSDIQDVQ